jgi:hypothetical protein
MWRMSPLSNCHGPQKKQLFSKDGELERGSSVWIPVNVDISMKETGKPILPMESLPSIYHCIQELPHEIQYHLEDRRRRGRSLGEW